METFKGLLTLLLVAVAVFTAVELFNKMAEPGYPAAVEKATVADTDQPVKPPAVGKTSSADTLQKSKRPSL